MGGHSTKRERGFSLLEMTIAIGLGSAVLAAAVQLYVQGVSATWTVSQRAEVQQDFRAASDMLTRDLSLAGAGLGQGVSIALPSGTTPLFGCDQTKCYLGSANSTGQTYPLQGTVPYMYGLLPGQNAGPTLNATQGATDTVTVVYTDSTFYLNCYTATITAKTKVTFTLPSPLTCTLPLGVSTAQAANDGVVGLTTGDLVLFTFSSGTVVGEVTDMTSNVATFTNSDALKMNQTGSTATGFNTIPLNAVGTGTRLLVVTYFIDKSVTPPVLKRQVNGHTPMAVAENVAYMKFSYDLYDDAAGVVRTDQADGGVTYSLLPNQITKINVKHMAMDSSVKGAKGGYQGLDLQTSVSARDLTYNNNYPIAP